MAISAIILQPADGQLMAAYRPIVYRVSTIRTDGQPVPPVVYCDIYFDGTYYKSLSKTQYDKLNTTSSEFEFDISKKELLAKWDSITITFADIDSHITKLLEELPSLLDFSKWGRYLPLKYKVRLLKDKYYDIPGAEQLLSTINLINNK